MAPAKADRTRATAAMVLVRGLKCAMVRRYSRECRFFAKGNVSPEHSPIILSDFPEISRACFPPCDGIICPRTSTEHPVVNLLISEEELMVPPVKRMPHYKVGNVKHGEEVRQ